MSKKLEIYIWSFYTIIDKLNDIFHLNDPVEISTMFEFLLFNGYLSKDKEFQALARKNNDNFLFSVRGAEVFTGKGVCRHIASMFTDILNEYGIESSTLFVYINLRKFGFRY